MSADEENYEDEPEMDTEATAVDVNDDGKDEDGNENDKAPALHDWMVRKGCWCSEFFDVLVEYGYDEPSKIKTIDEEMFDAMKHEILEQFTDVDVAAVEKFERMWRNRTSGPRAASPGVSPEPSPRGAVKRTTSRGRGRRGGGRKRRSPNPSPRSGGQVGAGFSGQSNNGASLKRWMKQKDCFKLELFEFLVSRGYTHEDQIAELMSKDVKQLLAEAEAEYMRGGRSGGMERSRFQNNSKKFVKAHRDVHGTDHILDQETLSSRATIWDSAQDTISAQAPELRTLLQREEFNVRALLEELVKRDITTPEQMLAADEDLIDDIIRVVRVAQMKDLQTRLLRERLDAKLSKFKVYWQRNAPDDDAAGDDY